MISGHTIKLGILILIAKLPRGALYTKTNHCSTGVGNEFFFSDSRKSYQIIPSAHPDPGPSLQTPSAWPISKVSSRNHFD